MTRASAKGVTRRQAITGVAAVSTASFSAPVIARDRRHIRMAAAWPKNRPGLGTGAQRTADAITQMSGGRLEIKLFASGELVPALDIFDAVREGTAEMGHSGAGYWIAKNKIEPRALPAAPVKRLMELSRDVVAETAALGEINRRIYDSWSSFRRKAISFAPFAEQGALNQRIA